MNSTASPMAGTMPRKHFPAGRPPLAVALPHPPWPPPPVAQPRLQGRLIPGRRWHGSPPLVPRCAPRRSSPRTDLASRHRGGPPPPRPRRADRGRGGCLQRWTWRSPCSVNSNPGCLHRRAQNGGSQVVGAGPSGCLGARTDHKGLCGTVPLKPGKGQRPSERCIARSGRPSHRGPADVPEGTLSCVAAGVRSRESCS
jgi:hypothetical protein